MAIRARLNLQKRVQAVKDEIKNFPNMKLLDASGGVFYHQETPEKAAEALQAAQNANPQIEGWALIGGWPLFTANALPWEAGKIKVVSVDALPAQLPYLETVTCSCCSHRTATAGAQVGRDSARKDREQERPAKRSRD